MEEVPKGGKGGGPGGRGGGGGGGGRGRGGPLLLGPSRGEQNDYCQHFVDTGQRPQNFLRDVDMVRACMGLFGSSSGQNLRLETQANVMCLCKPLMQGLLLSCDAVLLVNMDLQTPGMLSACQGKPGRGS